MNDGPFSVRVTPHGERLIRKLNRQHPDFIEYYEEAIRILRTDP